MAANQKATASGADGRWERQCWHLGFGPSRPAGKGSCLAVAAGKSVLLRLLRTTGHPREGQCCLSPREMEVY